MAKQYQRIIRSGRKPKNDRQYNGQKIPKGNQSSRNPTNDGQYNGQAIPKDNQKWP